MNSPAHKLRNWTGPVTEPTRDDHELIRACLEGSQESFAALVKRHEQRAFWAAYKILGDADGARDVAQEAFMRVWRALDRFDFSMAFTTWLYRITVNLAIDHLRRNKRHKGVDIDIFREALPDKSPGQSPDSSQDSREVARNVRLVLDTLDEKYRTVISLRDLEGLSSKQIADITGIAHATVRWRLHVARKQFREVWNRLETRNESRAHRDGAGDDASDTGRDAGRADGRDDDETAAPSARKAGAASTSTPSPGIQKPGAPHDTSTRKRTP